MPDVDLTARVRVPRNVVYRGFPTETVVLNLDTGRYHGVDRTGARMLEALDGSSSVAEAAERLSAEWDVSREQLEGDLRSFCSELVKRGLVTVDGGGD